MGKILSFMKTISCSELSNEVIVDVRAPVEYENHHIPGAVSIPLLENVERHEVGYLYKQVSVEKAYEKGFEFILQKLDKFIGKFLSFKGKKIVVHCARGGMRSGSVVKLLDNLGFDVYQLEGGMKAYRNFVLQEVDSFKFPKLIVLQGYTGSAKTKYIENLPNSIDLEKCANHQSSLFGAVGLKPNSQKMFMFLLYENLKRVKDFDVVFIEGEARKIGDVLIPLSLWEEMNKSYTVMLDVSLKNRASHIVERYPDCGKHASEYISIIKKLKEWLSNEVVEELVQKFSDGEYQYVVEVLLEKYYDLRYKHFISKIKVSETIDANDFEKTLELLREKCK